MRLFSKKSLALSLVVTLAVPVSAFATNGYFLIGYGAKSRSMGAWTCSLYLFSGSRGHGGAASDHEGAQSTAARESRRCRLVISGRSGGVHMGEVAVPGWSRRGGVVANCGRAANGGRAASEEGVLEIHRDGHDPRAERIHREVLDRRDDVDGVVPAVDGAKRQADEGSKGIAKGAERLFKGVGGLLQGLQGC